MLNHWTGSPKICVRLGFWKCFSYHVADKQCWQAGHDYVIHVESQFDEVGRCGYAFVYRLKRRVGHKSTLSHSGPRNTDQCGWLEGCLKFPMNGGRKRQFSGRTLKWDTLKVTVIWILLCDILSNYNINVRILKIHWNPWMWKKTNVVGILTQPSPIQITTGEWGIFKLLG